MDVDALASFNRVATHGGVGPASRATGQPKATLSRHVRELEEQLGVRLVERGTRTLSLTQDGVALHRRTEGLLAEIESVAQDIVAGSSRLRGQLRVSVPVLFAHTSMGRIAAGFAARYPEVELEVHADDRTVDLVTEGYDVVVRVDPRPDPGLVGRCVLRDRHVIVAPPSLPRPEPDSSGMAELDVAAVVLSGMVGHTPWRLAREGRTVVLHPRPVLRLSSLPMVRDAVRSGAGAAWLPLSLVADDLAAGRLACWGQASDRVVELWVLHTSRRLMRPTVEAFTTFLCEVVTQSHR